MFVLQVYVRILSIHFIPAVSRVMVGGGGGHNIRKTPTPSFPKFYFSGLAIRTAAVATQIRFPLYKIWLKFLRHEWNYPLLTCGGERKIFIFNINPPLHKLATNLIESREIPKSFFFSSP
jgi:hypothetical protein